MPFAIEELLALTAIDCSVAAVTVRTKVLEVTPLCAAVMLLEPVPTAEAKPAFKVVAAIFEELQVAEFVRFCVLPSLKIPVAVNCSVVPLARDAFGPLIVIDVSVAAVTARAKIFEVTPFCVAVILLAPTAAPASRPPGAIVAAGEEDCHVTELVRFSVLPSLKVPAAVNCSVVPLAIEEFGALIVMDCSVTVPGVTVRVKLLDVIPFWIAVITLDPVPTPVLTPPAVMLATVGFEELQAAELVRS